MNPKIVITMSVDNDIIWRVTRELKPLALTRLGLQEYEAVLSAAEEELYTQIRQSKKEVLTPAPASKGKK